MINKKCDIGDAEIEFETGKLAIQSPGSVVVKSGETMVLVTAVSNQEERMYSAGKIPGGFFRREGRQTEKAILACRLIDRPLRPSFKEGFRSETQIIATVLSVDNQNDYDILALNGASLALQIAGIPLEAAVGAVRMSLVGDEWLAQASTDKKEEAVFDMVVAGKSNENEEIDIVMVEAGATEGSLSYISNGSLTPDEENVANGLEAAKGYIKKIIKTQIEFAKSCEVPETEWTFVHDYSDELKQKIQDEYLDQITSVMSEQDRSKRSAEQKTLVNKVLNEIDNEEDSIEKSIKSAFNSIVKEVVRSKVIKQGIRLDGRKSDEIREISAEINVLP